MRTLTIFIVICLVAFQIQAQTCKFYDNPAQIFQIIEELQEKFENFNDQQMMAKTINEKKIQNDQIQETNELVQDLEDCYAFMQMQDDPNIKCISDLLGVVYELYKFYNDAIHGRYENYRTDVANIKKYTTIAVKTCLNIKFD